MLLIKNAEHQPPLVSILAVAANVAERLGITLRVTETIGNGTHGKWSLHYSFRAADFGSKEFSNKQEIVAELQSALGPKYDVLLENPGTDNEHFHVEYDPK